MGTPDQPRSDSPGPGWRGGGRGKGAAFLFLIVVAAAAIAGRYVAPTVIERAVVGRLNDVGIAHAELKVTSLSMAGIAIEGVELGAGGELAVSNLSLSLSWLDLLFGKLASFEISGFRLRLRRLDDGSLSLGALAPLFQGPAAQAAKKVPGGASGPDLSFLAWPIRTIQLRDAKIEIVSPAGETLLPFEGALVQGDDGTVVLHDGAITFVSPEVTLRSRVSGSMTRAGDIRATLSVVDGTLDLGTLAAKVNQGRIDVAGNLADSTAFTATGAVRVAASRAPLAMAPDASLELALRAGGLSIDFSVNDRNSGARGEVEIQFPDVFADDPIVATMATLSVADVARLPAGVGLPSGLTGNATARLSFSGRLSRLQSAAGIDSLAGLLSVVPRLEVTLDAHDIRRAEDGVALDVKGGLSFESVDGEIHVGAPDGLNVTANGTRDGAFERLLGPFYDSSAPGAARLRLDNGAAPLFVVALEGEKGLSVRAEGSVGVVGGGLPTMNGRFSVFASGDPGEARVRHFRIDDLRLSTSKASLKNGTVQLSDLSITGGGNLESFTGALALHASASGRLDGGARIDGGSVALTLGIDVSSNRAALELEGCSSVNARQIVLSGEEARTGPVDLCLESTGAPLISVAWGDPSGPQPSRFAARVRSRQQRVDVDLGPAGPVILRGPKMALRLGGAIASDGSDGDVHLRLDGVDAILPSRRLSLAGIGLDISARMADFLGSAAGNLAIDAVSDHHMPSLFRPLSVQAHVGSGSAGIKPITGRVHDGGALVVEFDGAVAPADNRGDVTLRARPIAFGPGKADVGRMFPVLKSHVRKGRGTVMTAARAQWDGADFRLDADAVVRQLAVETMTPSSNGAPVMVKARGSQVAAKATIVGGRGGPSTRGQILLENVSLDTQGVLLEGINTALDLSSLWPIRTHGPQEVSIAEATVGVPLSAGRVRFSVTTDDRLAVDDVSFELAGGTVSAAPFAATLAGSPPAIELSLQHVDLGRLVDTFGKEKLRASGTLNGKFPLVRRDNAFLISGGWLEAQGGGTIAYHADGSGASPESKSGEMKGGLGAVTTILENFRYDTLRLDVDGEVDGTLRVGARLSGRNDDYLGGVPVDLSVSLSGRVADLLAAQDGEREIPQTVKDRMLQFGQ